MLCALPARCRMARRGKGPVEKLRNREKAKGNKPPTPARERERELRALERERRKTLGGKPVGRWFGSERSDPKSPQNYGISILVDPS